MLQRDHFLYPRWRYWQQACHNPTSPSYPYIGARGIKVSGFKDFWAMVDYVETNLGPPPLGSGSRLARIDQKGDYAPGNLRWETGSQLVSRNRRSLKLAYNGKKQCLSAWCKELGLKRSTMYTRLRKYNWSVKRAFETPIREQRKNA